MTFPHNAAPATDPWHTKTDHNMDVTKYPDIHDLTRDISNRGTDTDINGNDADPAEAILEDSTCKYFAYDTLNRGANADISGHEYRLETGPSNGENVHDNANVDNGTDGIIETSPVEPRHDRRGIKQ